MSSHKASSLSSAAPDRSNEEMAPSESVITDWRGKPCTGRQLGGWRGAFCTIVSAGFGYFAYSGIYGNLVLYLIRVWKESNAGAANTLTNLVGATFFTSLIGAFLGDAYWGRLWTVVVFQVMFAVGCVLVGVAATLQEHSHADHLSGGLKAFLFFALYLMALGCGSYEPGIASLGGDQFDTPRQKATYFNWMSVFCNLGAPFCRQHKPGGNPFLRVSQVLVSAARKLKVKPETDPKLLYEVPGEYSAIPGCLKIQHRDKFRWLDKAATITCSDSRNLDSINAWHLCSVTQVEEVKGWISIIPVFIIGIIAHSVYAQSTTFFLEQGTVMNGMVGASGFKVPPGSMQIVTVLVITILAPVYDYILVPLCVRWTNNPKGITSLQRMGWGLLWGVISMVVASLLERYRLEAFQHGKVLSIWWLVPQFAIIGVSELLLIVGQMDFFYTEISESVRSLGMCLTLVCRGLGNFVSTFIVSIVTSISSRHNHSLGWIPKQNLNLGHLDYFYWLFASLMFLDLLAFVVYSSQFNYVEQIKPAPSNVNVRYTS